MWEPQYPDGLPIWPESDLQRVITDHQVQECILSYSDLSHHSVMQLASTCLAAGSSFSLLSPHVSMLSSSKPLIAVTAVRTGCGKSQISHYIIDLLKNYGLNCVLVRHPMPYGNLDVQRCQRFATFDDLVKHKTTIEEKEEYEQHIKNGTIVYAGVDYQQILSAAENEASCDVIIWDGGNNDTPFYRPDLWLCIADPHRAGHESNYYPGDVNFKLADVIIINKANTAEGSAVQSILHASESINPNATTSITDSEIAVDRPDLIQGKRVLIVEDGPTLTHGGMPYGAGYYAALKFQASEIVDPRPFLQGSMKKVLEQYPSMGSIIPAMGYFDEQVEDLEKSIHAVPDVDCVIIGTPMDLTSVLKIDKPTVAVTYSIREREPAVLSKQIEKFVTEHGPVANGTLNH